MSANLSSLRFGISGVLISTLSWLLPVKQPPVGLDSFNDSLEIFTLNFDVKQSFLDLLLGSRTSGLILELALSFSLMKRAPKSMFAQISSFGSELALDWLDAGLEVFVESDVRYGIRTWSFFSSLLFGMKSMLSNFSIKSILIFYCCYRIIFSNSLSFQPLASQMFNKVFCFTNL